MVLAGVKDPGLLKGLSSSLPLSWLNLPVRTNLLPPGLERGDAEPVGFRVRGTRPRKSCQEKHHLPTIPIYSPYRMPGVSLDPEKQVNAGNKTVEELSLDQNSPGF